LRAIKRQAGCLPIRGAPSELEVLLVTSRYTGEWIAPKGSIEAGEDSRQAAEREAEEEAGVTGTIGRYLGRFTYQRGEQPVALDVFVLWVSEVRDLWLEQDIRRRRWFPLVEAMRATSRPEVRQMLEALAGSGQPT
jgi:8-oxo-dGTP pyrophosphatase MutT (NUDIX family)